MIKRLHVPGYDQAREYFESAISEGIIEPNSKPGFYSQNQIKRVIKWIENQNK